MGLERRVASSASAGDEGAEKKVIGDEIEDSGVRFDARRQVKLGVCHDVQLDSLNTTNQMFTRRHPPKKTVIHPRVVFNFAQENGTLF